MTEDWCSMNFSLLCNTVWFSSKIFLIAICHIYVTESLPDTELDCVPHRDTCNGFCEKRNESPLTCIVFVLHGVLPILVVTLPSDTLHTDTCIVASFRARCGRNPYKFRSRPYICVTIIHNVCRICYAIYLVIIPHCDRMQNNGTSIQCCATTGSHQQEANRK